MQRYLPSCCLILLAGLLHAATVSAHDEGHKQRFVSPSGVDTGECDNHNSPCRTISYAATHAGKGDSILIESGNYAVANAMDVFHLTSGMIEVRGGYSRADRFTKADNQTNPTILIGVPAEYRETLVARGFQVIADQKSLDTALTREIAALQSELKELRSSHAQKPCINNQSGIFSCASVNLLSHVAFQDMQLNASSAIDIWGFVDLNTQREYALIGLNNGTAVFDVTDPRRPIEIGSVPGAQTSWRDIKVLQVFNRNTGRWQAYAYVTTDAANDRLTIINLSQLPNRVALLGHRTNDIRDHNIHLSNVDYTFGVELADANARIILAGSNLSRGGFRAYDTKDPANPMLLSVSPSRGYMHDAASMIITDVRKNTQCVDATAANCQLLFDFNESTFDIWDMTDISTPTRLSSTGYSGFGYVHSGWWSEDKQNLFVHDELDELFFANKTRVRVFDISDLTAPTLVGTWNGPTRAIDHNGFVRGNRYYMSNYTRGLIILDISDPTKPVSSGFFDTFPLNNRTSFNGAWGTYPFLASGNILVSDINSGLFVVEDKTRAVDQGQFSLGNSFYGAEEGNPLNVVVRRRNGSTGAVTVDYELMIGSANSADFTAATGTLTWPSGNSANQIITVNLLADAQLEPVEQLFVRLLNPTGGATLGNQNLASIFVADVGSASEVRLLSDSITVNESAGKAFVSLMRIGGIVGPVSTDYQTIDGTATTGTDYLSTAGTVTWTSGDASGRVIEIPLLEDDEKSPGRVFQLAISSVTGATVNGSSQATITLKDNVKVNSSSQTSDSLTPASDSGGGSSDLLLLMLGLVLVVYRLRRNIM